MSGAQLGRGTPKYQEVDRDGEIWKLKYVTEPVMFREPYNVNNTWGTLVQPGYRNYFLSDQALAQYSSQFPNIVVPIPSSFDVVLGPGGTLPSPLPSGLSAAQSFFVESTVYSNLTTSLGNPAPTPTAGLTDYPTGFGITIAPTQSWTQIIENATNAPIALTLGAGITPSTITVPANTIQEYRWEITSINPPAIRLMPMSIVGSGTGTVSSLTAGNGTVLTPNPITSTGVVSSPITSTTLAVTQAPDVASTINLVPTGVTPGTYTNATVTVNQYGEITVASSGAGGGGTVTDVTPGVGTTTTPGAGITSTGSVNAPITSTSLSVVQAVNTPTTINIPATGVTPGNYVFSDIAVNTFGQIVSATNGSLTETYGLGITGPTATGYILRLKQSWFQINIGTGGAVAPPGVLVASGGQAPLDNLGSAFTNDLTTFGYAGGNQFSFQILQAGSYLFNISFCTYINTGDGSSWGITTNTSAPFNMLESAFGDTDGPSATTDGPQQINQNFIGIFGAGTTTLRLTNVSQDPAHLWIKSNLVNLVNPNQSAGYINVIRLE